MLNLLGKRDSKREHCDGLSRRNFLKIGGMAAGGLSLAQLLQLEAQAGAGTAPKAIINVYLPGGPSHLDLFDLKPDAPVEVRGEFSPIDTAVPGIQICELFPRLARVMDKFTIIRSVVGSAGRHDCYQCMTGRTRRETMPAGGWPMMGSWVSKVLGPADSNIPANVSLMYPTGHRLWGEAGTGGFLGSAATPVSLVGKDPLAKATNMTLTGVSLEQLGNRKQLLDSVDRFRRHVNASPQIEQADTFTQRALGILTSTQLVDALDVSREDPRIVARYGKSDPTYQRDGAPKMVQNFLIARRLIEAGVRVVSMNYSRWDWHGGDGMNFPRTRQEAPLLDSGLSALLTDLHERGLDQDVSVVVWGEFGRTPKINKRNSRDHWPAVSFALVAGGGMKSGQVIGATNRLGEHAVERRVSFADIFATLYHNVGINATKTTVTDLAGRPQYLVDNYAQPISELI